MEEDREKYSAQDGGDVSLIEKKYVEPLTLLFGTHKRVSDFYINRNFVMGYVEMTTDDTSIAGIILIPRRLTLLLNGSLGDRRYEEFKRDVFPHQSTFDKEEGWKVDLNKPSLTGAEFLDTVYYSIYHPEPTQPAIVPYLDTQIEHFKDSVKEKLLQIDAYIHRLRNLNDLLST